MILLFRGKILCSDEAKYSTDLSFRVFLIGRASKLLIQRNVAKVTSLSETLVIQPKPFRTRTEVSWIIIDYIGFLLSVSTK